MTKQYAPRIVVASGNAGKIREINQILSGLHIEALPQTQFNVPDVEETGLTFVENAIIKARNAASHTAMPALADDSGIEVDALNGEPGIYSARYAAGNDKNGATDQANLDKLLAELKDLPEAQRSARFQCVMVYMAHEKDPTPIICQGTWEGRILFSPRGENGFGYDPVFYVPTHDCSAAELDSQTKNHLSHRGQALAAMLEALRIAGKDQ